GIRDATVTGVQTCALPIYRAGARARARALLRGLGDALALQRDHFRDDVRRREERAVLVGENNRRIAGSRARCAEALAEPGVSLRTGERGVGERGRGGGARA